MQLAFLLLTRGDVNQPLVWEKFFEFAPKDQFRVYCHPKDPSLIKTPLVKGAVIDHRIETEIGEISLVRATILLLKAAIADPSNGFFILCSESCVPIWDFPAVYAKVVPSGRSHIYCVNEHHPERRALLRDPHFIPGGGLFKQHQWMILNREAAELILAGDYTEIFADMYAPDEHYFVNLLYRLGYCLNEKSWNHMVTFVNWQDFTSTYAFQIVNGQKIKCAYPHPKTYCCIQADELCAARSKGCFFFRKVSPQCPNKILLEAVTPAGSNTGGQEGTRTLTPCGTGT